MHFTSVERTATSTTSFPADNFTGISNGQDTDNGYIEQAANVALEHGMSQSSGLKFLGFHEHGNVLNSGDRSFYERQLLAVHVGDADGGWYRGREALDAFSQCVSGRQSRRLRHDHRDWNRLWHAALAVVRSGL